MRTMILVDDQGARLVQEEPGLETYQRLVGGYIERWPYGKGRMTIWVNEDGIALDLPVFTRLDGQQVSGPIVAVIESRDLTEVDLEKFKARLS